MMDSFCGDSENDLKAWATLGASLCLNVAMPGSSLLVHAYGHAVTGLKTYRGAKRKEQLGVCSIAGFPSDSISVVVIMDLP
jgi:hypothetical protein